MLDLALYGCLALLALSPGSLVLRQWSGASAFLYAATILPCAVLAFVGIAALLGAAPAESLVLPLGLPWLGAHFRIDALAAFFVAVVGIGGAVTSLYAIGYGRHEHEPWRVLPFYPAFLCAMALVALAHDALGR